MSSVWRRVATAQLRRRWEDEGPVFWERVRRDGWFPGGCLACGGSLPEWVLEEVFAAVPEEDAQT